MSAMQRRKGAVAEREILRLLGDELGISLQRNLQQTREAQPLTCKAPKQVMACCTDA